MCAWLEVRQALLQEFRKFGASSSTAGEPQDLRRGGLSASEKLSAKPLELIVIMHSSQSCSHHRVNWCFVIVSFRCKASSLQAWPQLQVGLKICAKAGFNIHKAPAVWDDFEAAETRICNVPQPSVLSTHPAHDSRKVALRAEIESMQARGWAPGRTDDGLWDTVTTTRGYFAV